MRYVKEKDLDRLEALSRAYALSHPILGGDIDTALLVAQESMGEWDVDWGAQKHRSYHKAVPNRAPNKIILSRPALLQYIVCRQTTRYEIAHERAFLSREGTLTERTMLLRYVKHLLHESSSRSFYVTIGNCRVLHKYDHATTKRFYAVLDQRDQKLLTDGELDNKTDDQYRGWKMKLVEKLEQRFEGFVSVVHGPRNEKRFLPNDQPGEWAQYIKECLGLLTPWETDHVLPRDFEPTKFDITELKCENKRDKWDSAEENRMHTIIDPECFSILARACGAPAPEEQIDIPQFKSVEHEPGGRAQIGAPPEPTWAQAKTILGELARRGKRRKVAVSEHLSIEVDGIEHDSLNTTNSSGVQLNLDPESRQIQVFTTDAEGKLLLASLWLSLIDITTDTGWESSVVLEGGQRLGIEIKPVLNSDGELESLSALISYEERNPLRILSHYFEQIAGVVSRQLRLLLQALYGHRRAFATLVLFVATTLCLLIPSYKSDRLDHVSTHFERTDNVVGEPQPAPAATNSERLNPHAVVAGNLPRPATARDRLPAGGEQIVQLSMRLDGLDFASVYSTEPSEQALEMSPTELQALQRLYKNRFVLSGSYTGSEWLSSVEDSADSLATSDYRPVFLHADDIVGSESRTANRTRLASTLFSLSYIPTEERVTVVDRFHDHIFFPSPFTPTELRLAGVSDQDSYESDAEVRRLIFESFSSGKFNWKRRVPTFVADLSLGDEAQPLRRNRFQVGLPQSGQTAKAEFSWGHSAAYYRATAPYRTLKTAGTSSEHTSVRPLQLNLDYFNVFNTARRSPGATTALFNIGDTSRVTNFAAVNCVAPNPTDCGNPAPVGNPPSTMRLGLKFKF